MPLPVVAEVWQARFIITGSPLQRPASFALHFADDLGTQTSANLLADLDASATAGMWSLLSSNVGVTKLEVIPLDGVSASSQMSIASFPAKWTGSGGADAILQGSAVVSIKSARRGPRWRNRAYLGPVAEAKQVDGVLDSGTVATVQTAWNNFAASMLAAGWVLSVVSPSLEQSEGFSQLVVKPYLKTQRRRSRR